MVKRGKEREGGKQIYRVRLAEKNAVSMNGLVKGDKELQCCRGADAEFMVSTTTTVSHNKV